MRGILPKTSLRSKRSRLSRGVALVVLGSIAATVAACTSEKATLDAGSPAFEGLPPDVVQESLDDPSLRQALELFSDEEKPGTVQLNVASRIFCRELLAQYEDWVSAGAAPQVPRVATPTHPEPGFDDFMANWVQMTQAAIDSGDPDQLRSQLLAGGGCPDVVVEPSADAKETIADRLAG